MLWLCRKPCSHVQTASLTLPAASLGSLFPSSRWFHSSFTVFIIPHHPPSPGSSRQSVSAVLLEMKEGDERWEEGENPITLTFRLLIWGETCSRDIVIWAEWNRCRVIYTSFTSSLPRRSSAGPKEKKPTEHSHVFHAWSFISECSTGGGKNDTKY